MPSEPPVQQRKEVAWPSTSFERALAPVPGQRLREALLTTYSADLPAVVVALQAMAGHSGEAGDRVGPGKLTMVQTLESLRRANVRIAVQAGRLRGGTRARIAGVLDQFLYQVQQNEQEGSWHPKMALLRFTTEEEQVGEESDHWRFWMGSRNLASSENAELGLYMESAANGAVVKGLSEVTRALAIRAGYAIVKASRLAESLGIVRWALPVGCKAMEVFRPVSGLPMPGERVDELIVVSPFLNVEPLRQLSQWGGESARRTLVSTHLAMAEIARSVRAPLARFDRLLELQSPQQETAETTDAGATEGGASVAASLSDGEFTPYRRLHAKLIAIRQGRQHTFWMGSANATDRGWNGMNVEIVARMEVDRTLWEGLQNWVGRASLVDMAGLAAEATEDAAQQRLEDERKRLAAKWKGRLYFEAEHTRLVADSFKPSPVDAAVRLRVGLFTTGEMQLWPSGSAEVLLARASSAEQTGLVRMELSHADGSRLEWLMCCACEPELGVARDVAALSEYLGPGSLLAWWKASLKTENGFGADDEPWDAPDSLGAGVGVGERAEDRLTLEDMLRGWAKSPSVFKREGAKIAGYIEHWKKTNGESDGAAQELAHMHGLWQMIVGKSK